MQLSSNESTPSAACSLPKILAVAVLYKRPLSESESLSSLLRILTERPEWRPCFSLLVYDNSPQEQLLPPELPVPVAYVHDASNGGLAPAYQLALQQAESSGANWLLLLDQDTTLTEEFVAESLRQATELTNSGNIGAIVPKLVAKGAFYSPEADFLYQLRHQFQSMRHPVSQDSFGIQAKPMTAYNSGALLRVPALLAIGGFPSDFWLDYLDHAVFQELHQHGYQLHVLHASLQQNLSHMDINDVPHWRHRNVLTAQTRFVLRYGGILDRLLYRIYLLRICRFLFRQCHNRSVWKEMLLQVMPLRVPSVRLGK